MKKNYEQYLADLESGLAQIKGIIRNPKNRRAYDKAIKIKEVQEARIDFFKRGYAFRNRELRDQEKLDEPEKEENVKSDDGEQLEL